MNQGSYGEARPYLERALVISEEALGDDNPITARSLYNLAALLANQGSYEEARSLYERALAIVEEPLGDDNPLIKMIRQNLATLDTLQKE